MEEMQNMLGSFDQDMEAADAVSKDRKLAIQKWTVYHPLCGMQLRAYAGEILVSKVWPTFSLSDKLLDDAEERRAKANYAEKFREELQQRAKHRRAGRTASNQTRIGIQKT